MAEVNFCSTFRIPVSQPNINKAKKTRLKELIHSYNGLVGNSKLGYARLCIPNENDNKFLCSLKTIGYKIYQKFEANNIDNNQLDTYIKENLISKNYKQYGKSKI